MMSTRRRVLEKGERELIYHEMGDGVRSNSTQHTHTHTHAKV